MIKKVVWVFALMLMLGTFANGIVLAQDNGEESFGGVGNSEVEEDYREDDVISDGGEDKAIDEGIDEGDLDEEESNFDDGGDFDGDDVGDDKVEVCHIPSGNSDNARTIEVAESSVRDHLRHGDFVGECEEEISEEEIEDELGDGGSINGVDRFIDGIFQSDLENMRERFAEVRTLIREGRIDEAKKLLAHYKKVADNLEREVRPEDRDQAVRLTKVIQEAIENLEDRIVDEEEFNIISEKAENVEKAAEIASKIQELCKQLHDLSAWDEFERVCKTDDEGPRWQQDFFESLTDEQRGEAEKFGRILSSCMRTSGEDCDCQGIPHESMAAMCRKAAPLARDCKRIENGELDPQDERFDGSKGDACDQLDSLEFPDDLPRHLEEVLFRVEDEYGDASYDNHIPGPCKEVGIEGRGRDDREKCFAIMVEIEAPPECRDAIKKAGANNERDARNICEKIMFDKHAPKDCIEAGITNPEDCADLFEGDYDRRGPKRGPGFGRDCRGIEDSADRLACYDGVLEGDHDDGRSFEDRFRETRQRERECEKSCSDQGKAWDFSDGCRCFGEYEEDGEYYDDYDNFDHDDNYDDSYGGNYEGSDGEYSEYDGFDDGYFDEYDDGSDFSGTSGGPGYEDGYNEGADSGGVDSYEGGSGGIAGGGGGTTTTVGSDGGETSGSFDAGADTTGGSSDSGDSGGSSSSSGGEGGESSDGGSGGSSSGGSGGSGGDSGGSSGSGGSGGSGGDSGGSSGSGDSGGSGGGVGPTGGVIFPITGNAFLDYYYG
jgi:hypothetical protein